LGVFFEEIRDFGFGVSLPIEVLFSFAAFFASLVSDLVYLLSFVFA